MASIIRIKRSTGTSAPGTLKTGELAYSAGSGNSANFGDRLFFGKGDDGSGNATTVEVIGGAYFANLADHTPGTLTASSALIADASSKLDNLKVDNIDINGNTISSTDTDGNIVLDPNGTGNVDVSSAKITNLATPTSGTDAANKAYVDAASGVATILTINGETGSDTVNVTDSALDFVGGTGISTAVTDNTVTITTVDAEIVHDNLSGFVPNEHVDHSTVTLTASTGLTGGGDITASRSFSIDSAGLGAYFSKVIDHDATVNFVANEHIDHSTVTLTAGTGLTGGGTIADSRSFSIDSAELYAYFNHDGFTGFVANEHIDHSTVTLTAGLGLTGGGTIAASRTFNVGAGTGINVNADDVAIDSAGLYAYFSHDAFSGFVANEHVDHSTVTITAGDGLTGGGDITATRTLNVIGGDGITVNADEVEVTVDGSTIELSASDGSGAIRVKDAGITNAKLANSTITLGSSTLTLGSTTTDVAGLTSLIVDDIKIDGSVISNLSASNALYIDPAPVGDSAGGFAGQLIIRGDLVVQGTTTTVNSTTVSINDLNLVLADSAADAAAADGAGITIGGAGYSGTKATILYDGGNDRWNFNKNINLADSNALLFGGIDWKEVMQDHLGGWFSYNANNAITITYDDGANTLVWAAADATSTQKGVATFDETNFTVTSGDVTIAEVDGGTY